MLRVLPDNSTTVRIKDQLIGSASSIGANIAEGSSIYKGAKFASYIQIALDSACETDNWLQVLNDSHILHGNLDSGLLQEIIQQNREVIKMLLGLMQSIAKKRSEAL